MFSFIFSLKCSAIDYSASATPTPTPQDQVLTRQSFFSSKSQRSFGLPRFKLVWYLSFKYVYPILCQLSLLCPKQLSYVSILIALRLRVFGVASCTDNLVSCTFSQLGQYAQGVICEKNFGEPRFKPGASKAASSVLFAFLR